MNVGMAAPRRLASGLVVVAAVLVGGGLTACSDDDSGEGVSLVPTEGGEPAEDATDATDATDDEGAEPAGAASRSLTGTWEGTFECDGTETGLTLAVDDRGDGTAAASFEYHPVDGASGSTGRYSMDGAIADGQLSLTGGVWQEPLEEDGGGDRPMVGLEAAVGERPDSEHLEGSVVGEGCTTFTVDRVSTDPWYVGTFTGGYGCNQGLTSLDLTIEDAGDRAVEATFEFSEHPDNPGVPSGSYRMEGTYVDGEMVLSGVEWIEQPEGYVMVDLRLLSRYGIDPNWMHGVVQAPGVVEDGCSIFVLARVEDGTAEGAADGAAET